MVLLIFIYLDYVVIMLVDFYVVDVMLKCLILDGNFGNFVFCSYCFGWMVEEVVDVVRN